MMVAMAGLQVFIVRFFFQVSHAVVTRQQILTDVSFRAHEKDMYEELLNKLLHWKAWGVGMGSVYYYMHLPYERGAESIRWQ